jgi:hypothetical protein
MRINCPKCDHSFNEPANLNSVAGDALRELVELKRMKDAGAVSSEYERRKLIAWREAFRACGVVEEPRP